MQQQTAPIQFTFRFQGAPTFVVPVVTFASPPDGILSDLPAGATATISVMVQNDNAFPLYVKGASFDDPAVEMVTITSNPELPSGAGTLTMQVKFADSVDPGAEIVTNLVVTVDDVGA